MQGDVFYLIIPRKCDWGFIIKEQCGRYRRTLSHFDLVKSAICADLSVWTGARCDYNQRRITRTLVMLPPMFYVLAMKQ